MRMYNARFVFVPYLEGSKRDPVRIYNSFRANVITKYRRFTSVNSFIWKKKTAFAAPRIYNYIRALRKVLNKKKYLSIQLHAAVTGAAVKQVFINP